MTFLDTNILLYAISAVPEERTKALTAREILRRDDLNPGQSYQGVRVINPFL